MKEIILSRRRAMKTIVSLLMATALFFSTTPVVLAEEGQPVLKNEENTLVMNEEMVTPNVVRYQGRSRDNVAETVAKEQFSDSNKVIIVNRDKFPDAISATNISQGRYPVLYTHAGHVLGSTLDVLKQLPLDEIYVLGGTLSVNNSVIEQLTEEMNVTVTRVAGRSRYDANVSAVKETFNQAGHVVIASGEVYSDALYGVSYANTIGAPVVLTNTNSLGDSTVSMLKELGVKDATIIGGILTVTEAVETQLDELEIEHNRIAGRNRYIGSAEVATASYENPENIVIASGEVFSDALVSAPLAQKLNAPILLVRSNSFEEQVNQYLAESTLSLDNIYIQGGPLTISTNIEERIAQRSSHLVVSDTIPYETETIKDSELFEGQTKVVQDGIPGEEIVYYYLVYENGVESERIKIHRESNKPTNEIISIGTKVDIEGVEAVDEMILSIPAEVTLSDKDLIVNARQAYEELTPKQKALIDNLDYLETAEAHIVRLENTYTLSIKVSPIEGGTVIGADDFEAGEEVQLYAASNEGFVFKNWLIDGEAVSNEDELTYTMPNNDIEITANFQSISEPYLSFNSRTGTITGYDIAGGRDVVIPSSINGVEVRAIGSNAFESLNITSVILPESIISIERNAFRDNLLSKVDFPKNLIFIGFGAFNNNLLTSIEIPEKVEIISGQAFGHNNLTNLVVPEGITEIGSFAFYSNNLVSVELPQSLTKIDDYAFSNNFLTTISTPTNLTYLGDGAFNNNELEDLNLNNNITHIGSSAFSSNNLKKIRLPEKLISLGSSAFRTNDLREIIFNEELISIEEEAFLNNNLTEIILPENLISIGDGAFNRNNLQRVAIGENVFIGDGLLSNNNLFRDVYLNSTDGGAGTYERTYNGTWIKQ